MTTPQPIAQPRRAAMASFIGTTIEWYDFYSYAKVWNGEQIEDQRCDQHQGPFHGHPARSAQMDRQQRERHVGEY